MAHQPPLTFAQRYQLIKEIHEQIHSMIVSRTAEPFQLTALRKVAQTQSELLAMESEQELLSARKVEAAQLDPYLQAARPPEVPANPLSTPYGNTP